MGRTQKNITKSKIAKSSIPKIRDDILEKEIPYPKHIPSPAQIAKDIEARYYSYSLLEIIWWLLQRPIKVINFIIKIVKLINWINKMTDPKTTKSAKFKLQTLITTGLTAILAIFGLNLAPELITIIVSIGVIIYGYFDWKQGKDTKDAD